MSRGARLLANLGGEEETRWRGRESSLLRVAQLWGLLFGDESRLLSDPREIPWPPALGARPREPVFPWLEDGAGLVCWLETRDARADPRAAGLAAPGPSPEDVARVHDKAFAHRCALRDGFVPRSLRDLIGVLEPAELADADAAVRRLTRLLESWPAWARARFTLKPRFGSSGRGRVSGVEGIADTSEIRGALPRLASLGGALLEPWLDRSLDLSAQFRVDPEEGTLMLGTLEQLVTPSGSYRGHRGWVDSRGRVVSGSDYDEALREAAAALASAAAREGYFGPASLDAFAFRLPEQSEDDCDAPEVFRPVVELNGRFTLGTIALGLVRRALGELKAPLGLEPGNRRAFVFGLSAPPGGWQAAASGAGRLARLVPLWQGDGAGPDAQPALLFAETARDLDATATAVASN